MRFGRLERAPLPAPMSEINMTPLIDVMLVLLVIFMITAPLFVSAVKLDLPKASGTSATTAPQFIGISIDAQGIVYLNNAAMDNPALDQQLHTTAQQNPDTEIQLRADAKVPYGRVLEVMGLAQKAGLNRIGFVAEPQTNTP